MKEIFQRFMFLFHWLGFICLVTMLGGYALELSGGGTWFSAGDVTDIIPNILDDMLSFQNYRSVFDREAFWITWLAVTHYPIKWILTGNKSPFPWKG